MRAAIASAVLLAGMTVTAAAWAGPFSVKEIDGGARREVVYHCAGPAGPLRVAYWNARNGQSFALVPVAGRPLLFVDTVAGSGAKYQADHYVWWTKGRGANLYDVLAGEQAAPVLADCNQVDRLPARQRAARWPPHAAASCCVVPSRRTCSCHSRLSSR